jgi:hypothetical protein
MHAGQFNKNFNVFFLQHWSFNILIYISFVFDVTYLQNFNKGKSLTDLDAKITG